MKIGSNKEEFENYREVHEKAGIPVDANFAKKMRKEMERLKAQEEYRSGEKSGWHIPTPEPSKKEKLKGNPEGGLYETDLTVEELQLEISSLVMARESVTALLTDKVLQIPREATLSDLKNMNTGSFKEKWNAITSMAKLDFDDSTMVFDLPEEIKERISKETRILEHLEKGS